MKLIVNIIVTTHVDNIFSVDIVNYILFSIQIYKLKKYYWGLNTFFGSHPPPQVTKLPKTAEIEVCGSIRR